MWPHLPKKCNCSETPNNEQLKCNHEGLTTNDIAYTGDDLLCTGIESGDRITEVVQILDYYICSDLFAQHFLNSLSDNIEEFPTFVELVNNSIDCDVVNFCLTSTTTSTSSTSSTTSTSTTQCPQENLLLNSDFTSNLDGWSQSVFGAWNWTPQGAHFNDVDNFSNFLYQDILTVGNTYDISFLMTNNYYCPEFIYINVRAGDTEYGPITQTGTHVITLTMTCTGNGQFGFNAYDSCGTPTYDHLYIRNVSVSEHCSGFTTTTTTSTVAPTTSTTTTEVVECVEFTLLAIIPNASWTASTCNDEPTAGVIPLTGTTGVTGCVLNNTLVLNGASIVDSEECTTTTSTTSTSSTTTTTTTAIPTTTTTTTAPLTTTTTTTNASKLIFHNNSSAGIINDIYATAWLIATYTPTGPGQSMYGDHGNTIQPVQADIDAQTAGCLSMYINGALIQSININFIGLYTYSFTPVSIHTMDHVIFVYNDGVC